MKGKIAVIRILIILLSAALLLGGMCYFVQEYQIQSQSHQSHFQSETRSLSKSLSVIHQVLGFACLGT